MGKPKILAFAGSLRSGSFNKKLIKVAVEGALKAGGEVTYVDLRDFPLPIFDQDFEAKEGLPKNALKLKELFLAHEGLLISSPEYNSSISGVLKNTIDWVSRGDPSDRPLACFDKKIAGVMSASPGALGGLRGLVHVRAILGNIKVLVLPDQLAVPKADEAFNPDGSLKDPRQQSAAQKIGASVVGILSKLNS